MPLTTLGYGDPTFAAFYPNCHSVFGLHDETAEPGKTYTYDIVGYYEPKTRLPAPKTRISNFLSCSEKT
ncbi:MAG: hypothetical protein H7319_04940 [Spirosoma sp.]|nr:hypothetical protein [Spirosoma sp.]